MLSKEDEKILQNPDYNFELEKLYYPKSYSEINSPAKQVYCFSNEYLDGIYSHFNFKNKRVLTVGSSGDQAINAYIFGATQVEIIDANIWTLPYTEYKIAAIKNLSFQEFRDAFIENANPFDWKVYSKISHDLSGKTKEFWDTIVLNQQSSTETYEKLVHTEGWKSRPYLRIYKNERLYNMAKQKLQNATPKFIYCEFSDFASKSSGMYDIILLSNIYKYVTKEGSEKFVEVVNNLYEKLNPCGKMQIHYEYNNPTGIPKPSLTNLFPSKKVKYAMIGKHFCYYLSKPSEKRKNNIEQEK